MSAYAWQHFLTSGPALRGQTITTTSGDNIARTADILAAFQRPEVMMRRDIRSVSKRAPLAWLVAPASPGGRPSRNAPGEQQPHPTCQAPADEMGRSFQSLTGTQVVDPKPRYALLNQTSPTNQPPFNCLADLDHYASCMEERFSLHGLVALDVVRRCRCPDIRLSIPLAS